MTKPDVSILLFILLDEMCKFIVLVNSSGKCTNKNTVGNILKTMVFFLFLTSKRVIQCDK